MDETTESLADIVRHNPETWLYCLHCGFFFRAGRLRQGGALGKSERCPFCPAEGLGIDIFQWRPYRCPTSWPRSKDVLRDGMRVPT